MTFLRTVVLLSFCGINCAAAAQDIKDLTAQEREYLGFLAGGHCRSMVKTSGTFEKEPMDKMVKYWRGLLAHPITKSCRNAAAFAALSRHQTTEDNVMPFLFWMPMIVMCGLWRAAEADTQALFPPQQ